jgi:tripartite-type tricarboxylate transporter receptor subunit TctC
VVVEELRKRVGRHVKHSAASRLAARVAATLIAAGCGASWALGLDGTACAQAWPSRQPIRMVVPFTAGSAVDVMARIVMAKVSGQIGQTIVTENRVGAGGTLGMAAVAKADPDGYTLLASSSAHTITPSIYAHLPYDATKDFAGVIPFGNLPNALVANPVKYGTIRDLVAAAKVRPGAVTYGSGGVGAVAHLNAERFRLAAGFEAVHVPYKGAPEALTDVIAGRIDFYFSPLTAALPLIRDGQVRALPCPPRRADHARGRLRGVRLRLLGRAVRAGRHAARDRGTPARRNRQGPRHAGDPRSLGEPRRRADADDAGGIRRVPDWGNPRRRRHRQGGGHQAELSSSSDPKPRLQFVLNGRSAARSATSRSAIAGAGMYFAISRRGFSRQAGNRMFSRSSNSSARW